MAETERICGNCRHYEPGAFGENRGTCGRWLYGYGVKEFKDNEPVVENDEGWGALMGPNFGCVLWEQKNG